MLQAAEGLLGLLLPTGLCVRESLQQKQAQQNKPINDWALPRYFLEAMDPNKNPGGYAWLTQPNASNRRQPNPQRLHVAEWNSLGPQGYGMVSSVKMQLHGAMVKLLI